MINVFVWKLIFKIKKYNLACTLLETNLVEKHI